MQTNLSENLLLRNGIKSKSNHGVPTFSTYISKDLNSTVSSSEIGNTHQRSSVGDPRVATANVSSSSSSSSSGSWAQGGGLPPPPSEQDLLIQPGSIPEGPAKPWDSVQSDEDDLSDEGVAENDMDLAAQDSDDSCSDDHESECTTEIYIPMPGGSTAGIIRPSPIAHQRRVVSGYTPSRAGTSGLNHQQRRSEVIPSVSNDNLHGFRSPPPVKLTSALTSEDIATNIDSGISNETSNVHSHEGTVIPNRTMSVSSSSHYSSSYSCGSRGEIPSPTIGQSRIDDITVYMREAKVSRVVSFLSAAYAIILILLGVIFPIFEINGTVNDSFAFEGFYIYLYGLGIFFLTYAYAAVIKEKKHKDTLRKQALTVAARGNGTVRSAALIHHHCPTHECPDSIPIIGSLFLRITVVLFCVGGLVDSGLKFGIHLGDRCPTHFLTTVQPVAQALFMFFEVYFVFNNTKMCVRQYPIVAKFGIMHLIATNICIYILSTFTEIKNNITHSSGRMVSLQGNSNYTYYQSSDTESLANTLTVLNYNKDTHTNCTHSTVMVEMAYKSKPYTFPCTVQFCILVTCVLFVMWRKIDIDSDTQCSDCREHTKRSSRSATRTIDCGNTSRGLFLGIVALVSAIACLIIFFVFTANDYYDAKATLVIHIYQIALYLLMTVIAVVVLLKLRPLDHNSCKTTKLEDTLIVICVLALLTHDLLNIISGILNLNQLKGLLVLATSAAELIQSVVQMAAIVMGLKLCIPDVPEATALHRYKPGRECVTFLIIANISLWMLSLFNNVLSQGFDRNLPMMGQHSWGIVLNIVSPFVMFYHLFSASCFVDIWYNAYRMPSAPIVQV